MSGTPTLAVIIPAYNACLPLSNTLAGLAVQAADGPVLETIVIDNNSSQGSLDMLHRRFCDTLNMTLIHQPALPHPFALARARNVGMRLSTADWILLLDADCVPGPGFLKATQAAIDEHGKTPMLATGERKFVDALRYSAITTPDDLAMLETMPRIESGSNYGLTQDRRLPAMRELPRSPHPWAYMHGGVLLYRASEALLVRGFDERYDGHWGYEDADFAYRMIVEAACVPQFVEGMAVFHQEAASGFEGLRHKWEKRSNPNWHRVCAVIPGFEDFKRT